MESTKIGEFFKKKCIFFDGGENMCNNLHVRSECDNFYNFIYLFSLLYEALSNADS